MVGGCPGEKGLLQRNVPSKWRCGEGYGESHVFPSSEWAAWLGHLRVEISKRTKLGLRTALVPILTSPLGPRPFAAPRPPVCTAAPPDQLLVPQRPPALRCQRGSRRNLRGFPATSRSRSSYRNETGGPHPAEHLHSLWCSGDPRLPLLLRSHLTWSAGEEAFSLPTPAAGALWISPLSVWFL